VSALTVSWPTFQSGTDPSEVNQAFCNWLIPGINLQITADGIVMCPIELKANGLAEIISQTDTSGFRR
jgi:hypothetical protein